MLQIKSKGDFKKTKKFLSSASNLKLRAILDKYGKMGVDSLSGATPIDSGKTASSWSYEIKESSSSAVISWTNSNVNGSVNIAIILQYGHGTGTGGYVSGRDYINPAMRPVFDKMAEDVWREVVRS